MGKLRWTREDPLDVGGVLVQKGEEIDDPHGALANVAGFEPVEAKAAGPVPGPKKGGE